MTGTGGRRTIFYGYSGWSWLTFSQLGEEWSG
jgi:hypothetical protein